MQLQQTVPLTHPDHALSAIRLDTLLMIVLFCKTLIFFVSTTFNSNSSSRYNWLRQWQWTMSKLPKTMIMTTLTVLLIKTPQQRFFVRTGSKANTQRNAFLLPKCITICHNRCWYLLHSIFFKCNNTNWCESFMLSMSSNPWDTL